MNFAKERILEEPIKNSQSTVYTGSSVIGLKYNKGIIIACDTLMHYGSSLSLTHSFDRIKVLNNRTVIGYSGEYSDMQETQRILDELILEDQLETNKNGCMGPIELGHYLSRLHYHQRNQFDPYLNSAIIGGIDFNGDIVLMQVDPFGTFLTANYFTTAFANYFACSLLRNEYPKDPKEITKEQAIKLILKCFEVLFYRDSKAGDVIQYTTLEMDNNMIKTDTQTTKLETKWEHQQFMQGNEKNYLVA